LDAVGTEQTFERNWHDGNSKQQYWQYTEYLLFSCSVIFIHKWIL